MAQPFVSPGNPELADIVARVRERIVELQRELEQPLDLDTTNRARGAIAELRRFVADADPAKAPAVAITPRYDT